jgi:hypothetical protein
MMNLVGVLFLFMILLPMRASGQDCGGSWNWADPSAPGNDLESVAYIGREFVAVGDYGTILSSTDGVSWTAHPTGWLGTLYGIAGAPGLYVAVGEEANPPYSPVAACLTSPDLTTWTVHHPQNFSFHQVAYGLGRFFAVPNQLPPVQSVDGVTWRPVAGFEDNSVSSITFSTDRFLMIDQWHRCLVSLDGQSFSPLALPGFTVTSIVWTGSMYVTVGERYDASQNSLLPVAFTSPDGVNWTQSAVDPPGFLKSNLAVGDDGIVGIGDGCFLFSQDGTRWTRLERETRAKLTGGVAYGAGRFVTVGQGGTRISSENGTIWASQTGDRWSRFDAVAQGPDGWVLIAYWPYYKQEVTTIYFSRNGVDWSPVKTDIPGPLYRVAYGNNLYVAVGYPDESLTGLMWTSPDGLTWTQQDASVLSMPNAIAFGGGRFAAAGPRAFYTSTDGVHWQTHSGLHRTVVGMTYGSNQFCAVTREGEAGTSGSILVSQDGAVWTVSLQTSGMAPQAVAYGAGRFVAAGSNGSIFTQMDNGSWTTAQVDETVDFRALTYAAGQWVAVGKDIWASHAQASYAYTSEDGITWTKHLMGTSQPVYALAFCDGIFLAAGESGAMLSSACSSWIDRLSPSRGSTAGGQWVTLSGGGLGSPLGVRFGGLPATAIDPISDSVLRAQVPPQAAGVVDVTVDLASGGTVRMEAGFGYQPPPTISRVAVLTGPFRLAITGDNFETASVVRVNGTSVPVTAWKSPTSVVAKGGATLKGLVPPGQTVSVSVDNGDGILSAPFSCRLR